MAKKFRASTLGEFITQQQNAFPYATGDLSRLLTHIGIASKIVNREVNMAGLVDILGETGTENIQGESVKKLDAFANEQFKSILGSSIEVCGMVTEEEKTWFLLKATFPGKANTLSAWTPWMVLPILM